MTSIRFWADLTSEAFRGLDGARAIAVLPLAAIEQHGPHLPVSVDRDIVDEVVRRSFAVIDPGLSVLFLRLIRTEPMRQPQQKPCMHSLPCRKKAMLWIVLPQTHQLAWRL